MSKARYKVRGVWVWVNNKTDVWQRLVQIRDGTAPDIDGMWTYVVTADPAGRGVHVGIRLTHVNDVIIPKDIYAFGRPSQFLIRDGLTIDDFELVIDDD